MIFFVIMQKHQYTISPYLDTWGKELQQTVRLIPYESLARFRSLPCGTYIFSDLERFSPSQTSLVTDLWHQLQETKGVRLLNHPSQSLRRYELLKMLYGCGVNQFDVHRVAEGVRPQRFPVFLRQNSDHTGSLTNLIGSQEELHHHLVAAALQGFDVQDLLVVQYCDTADSDGLFRKYAAFRVGDAIVPRQIIVSKSWVVKYPGLLEPRLLEQEAEYLHHNPHRQLLLEIFQRAHIEYGRIDYSLYRGTLQVWEINTNPMILRRPEQYPPEHLPLQQHFAERITAAFRAIAGEAQPSTQMPIRWRAERLWEAPRKPGPAPV